jgi:predicted N-acetyltransferase YhbS
VSENEIVGHIISTKAKIIDSQNDEYEILCVGPLSVSSVFRKRGIGSELLNESIQAAKKIRLQGYDSFWKSRLLSPFWV